MLVAGFGVHDLNILIACISATYSALKLVVFTVATVFPMILPLVLWRIQWFVQWSELKWGSVVQFVYLTLSPESNWFSGKSSQDNCGCSQMQWMTRTFFMPRLPHNTSQRGDGNHHPAHWTISAFFCAFYWIQVPHARLANSNSIMVVTEWLPSPGLADFSTPFPGRWALPHINSYLHFVLGCCQLAWRSLVCWVYCIPRLVCVCLY